MNLVTKNNTEYNKKEEMTPVVNKNEIRGQNVNISRMDYEIISQKSHL